MVNRQAAEPPAEPAGRTKCSTPWPDAWYGDNVDGFLWCCTHHDGSGAYLLARESFGVTGKLLRRKACESASTRRCVSCRAKPADAESNTVPLLVECNVVVMRDGLGSARERQLQLARYDGARAQQREERTANGGRAAGLLDADFSTELSDEARVAIIKKRLLRMANNTATSACTPSFKARHVQWKAEVGKADATAADLAGLFVEFIKGTEEMEEE